MLQFYSHICKIIFVTLFLTILKNIDLGKKDCFIIYNDNNNIKEIFFLYLSKSKYY